jgi:GTP-binding protein
MSNIVAIVGRPNVGKSTLFNRLIGQRKAIIHESSGVTRDRHYGKSEWNGMEFSVIDTGGFVENSDDVFEEEIRKQVILAIEESDIILFVVDVLIGVTDLDENVAQMLRKCKKPVFLTVNKVDTSERLYDANDFYRLGLGEIYCISSVNGAGTGDLLDALTKAFPKPVKELEIEDDIPKFSIVGRPNVGKSSLINALLNEERNIVTPIAGTTRDTLHTRYNKFGHDFYLVDTAGLRKKGKIIDEIEFYSTMRSVRAIENSDVCLLMLDATQGIEAQDLNIFSLIEKNHKGVVILVNKWDLVEKENNATKEFTETIKSRIAPFSDVPILFISALTKQRIFKALELAVEVYHNRRQKITTSQLNTIMLEEIENHHPPVTKGKEVRIKYITQLPIHYPVFAFFCNLPQYVKDPYKRFLENKIRSHFNFSGVPIEIFMRKK